MPNVMDQDSCSHVKNPRSSRADISNHPRENVSDLKLEYGAQESLEAQKLTDLLVRHERNVAMKTEVASRRLERMEKEKDNEADTENEANLEQAVEDKSKFAKLVVDKWCGDKGFGFGKVKRRSSSMPALTKERCLLMVGTDAWTEVVSDGARAKGVGKGVPSTHIVGTRGVEGRETTKRRPTTWCRLATSPQARTATGAEELQPRRTASSRQPRHVQTRRSARKTSRQMLGNSTGAR